MRLRKITGEFPIRLIASANGHKTSLTAMQSVSADEPAPVVEPRRWSHRKLAILGIVSAGVAAGLIVASMAAALRLRPVQAPGSLPEFQR